MVRGTVRYRIGLLAWVSASPLLFVGCLGGDLGPIDDRPTDERGGADEEEVGEAQQAVNGVTTVSGMSRYCNKHDASTGRWSFNYGSQDPCVGLPSDTPSIARAGLYSTSGWNRVYVRCAGGYWVDYKEGNGSTPLYNAWSSAWWAQGLYGDCTFDVAPKELPLFRLPFDSSKRAVSTNDHGFDHDRIPYSATAIELDFNNQWVDFNGPDLGDHPAHDIGNLGQVAIRAVADGEVLQAGFHWSSATEGGGWFIIVRHVASTGNSTYDEAFATGYWHNASIVNSILQNCTEAVPQVVLGGNCSPGVYVTKGMQLGNAGPDHLHFVTWRMTNTTKNRSVPNSWIRYPNLGPPLGESVVVDPYGWRTNFLDPWAYEGWFPSASFPNGAGAQSINLWLPDNEPNVTW